METCDISQARWWCRAVHVLLVIPFSERYKKTESIRRWTHLRTVLCVNRASCKRFWWNILKKARKVKPVGGVDEWGYVFVVNPFGDKHKKKQPNRCQTHLRAVLCLIRILAGTIEAIKLHFNPYIYFPNTGLLFKTIKSHVTHISYHIILYSIITLKTNIRSKESSNSIILHKRPQITHRFMQHTIALINPSNHQTVH